MNLAMNHALNKTLSQEKEPLTLIFWGFVIIHLLAWTLVPFFIRHTLPMDSMEGYVWGQQLEWGYDKNPFLNGWLTALAIYWGGYSGWMIYLFSQLSVILCFWAVWQLGKQFLPPVYALIGVLLLEGIQYYNFHAIDFNDNTLELSLWALLILYFYKALRSNSKLAWINCGLFAGLSVMAKYYAIVLLAPMTLFFLLFKENYKSFKSAGLYLGLTVFLLIITPHFIWLVKHDFVTLGYAVDRVSSPPTFWNHLSYPWQFFYEQLEAFCPAIFLALALLIGKKPLSLPQRLSFTTFDKYFLMIVGLGPFICTILLSLVTGFKLRAGWGQPLFSLAGILLLAYLQPRITRQRLAVFVSLLGILLSLALVGYSLAFIRGKATSSANFPGKTLAATLTQAWHQQYHQPLAYVAGSRWLSGNLAFYSKDHPHVYINWSQRLSPWINEAELEQKGGIFIWEIDKPIPEVVLKRFPRLSKVQMMQLKWLRNKNLPPIQIMVAYLPPTGIS